MAIRLNKLISDYGICTRKDADKFIQTGRVTVNGKQPEIGMKVTETDIVIVDDARISIDDIQGDNTNYNPGTKATELIWGERKNETPAAPKKKQAATEKSNGQSKGTNKPTGAPRREHYVKYNKFAAARKAGKQADKLTEKQDIDPIKEKIIKEAVKPAFGKSLSRGAVAQRLQAAPKSASLRKTSKNNPTNKAKYSSGNKPKGNK